ncbi:MULTISPECIES: hypothetical protein [unclassified Carboxylicivirga]|uniref:hypothetical protein n=1 Tax=Carboxylicivirga TaxID=1628153 RepID=UPI003D3448DF
MRVIYSFFVLLFLGNCLVTMAQEEISQDVKVVKEYTPTVSDAYKISYMPQLGDSGTVKPRFNYHILSTSVATDYQPSPIEAAKIKTARKEYLHKTYLKGGVGNYSTLEAELGYNILANEEYVLGLQVGHISSLGNITLEDDNTVDAPYHNTSAGLDFKHFFDDKTLLVNMDFDRRAYQYYGYQTLSPEGAYVLPNGELVGGMHYMPEEDQRLSLFKATVGLYNNEADVRKTRYNANAGIESFGTLTGVNQFGVLLNGQVHKPIDNIGLRLDAGIEAYKTNVPDSLGPRYTFDDRSQLLVRVQPSLTFNFDRAKLRVGMLLAGVIDTQDDKFYVTPDVLGELTVVEGIATVYAGMNGRVSINDYASMMYENNFAAADVNVKSSVYGLNFVGGVKGNFSAATSFSAGLEYGLFNDEHFWVNRSFSTREEAPGLNAAQDYGNIFDVVYDDGSLLKVHGELLYRPKESMNFALSGAYYGWHLDEQLEAWHKPEVELALEGNFKVMENLHALAGIHYMGERWAYDVTRDDLSKKLKGVVDVNVEAEYFFSKQWSFWVAVNNLMAAKYYQWNGYPMQGFNARAGIIFSF